MKIYQLRSAVYAAISEMAKARGLSVADAFGDSLSGETARLQLFRQVRKALPEATRELTWRVIDQGLSDAQFRTKPPRIVHQPVCVQVAKGELWEAPRGFGEAYKRTAKLYLSKRPATRASLNVLRDLLSLVGYSVTIDELQQWGVRQRVAAHVYATYTHLRASDQPVPVPPRPAWLLKSEQRAA